RGHIIRLPHLATFRDARVAEMRFRVRPVKRKTPLSALVLDRKKLAAFSAAAGRFLLFPIGDRPCNRTPATLANAAAHPPPQPPQPLSASPLLPGRPPIAPCSKGLAAASRLIVAASTV